jgi:hypothetical protein
VGSVAELERFFPLSDLEPDDGRLAAEARPGGRRALVRGTGSWRYGAAAGRIQVRAQTDRGGERQHRVRRCHAGDGGQADTRVSVPVLIESGPLGGTVVGDPGAAAMAIGAPSRWPS